MPPRVPLIGMLLALANCGMPLFKAPAPPPPAPLAPPSGLLEAPPDSAASSEYAVYRFLISRLEREHRPVLLLDSIVAFPAVPQASDSAPRHLDRSDSSLEAGFRAANRVALRLQRDSLSADTSVVLLPYSTLTEAGLRLVRARYPAELGFFTFSRVGFNLDSTRAGVYVSHIGLRGGASGRIVLVARLRGRAWTLWADYPTISQ